MDPAYTEIVNSSIYCTCHLKFQENQLSDLKTQKRESEEVVQSYAHLIIDYSKKAIEYILLNSTSGQPLLSHD